jgi:hypothetical protein
MPDMMSNMSIARRKVQLLVGESRSLSGEIHIPEGQDLIGFLRTRRHFLNVTNVSGMEGGGGADVSRHTAVRVEELVWIRPVESDLALTTMVGPNARPREVRFILVGGRALTVKMRISAEQRLTDYFDSNTGFIPLYDVMLDGAGHAVPELALNHRAILAIQELTDTDPKASQGGA